MVDALQELLSALAMVDETSLLGKLAHRRLNENQVEAARFGDALPEGRIFLEDLGEFRLRDTILGRGIDQFLAADTSAPKSDG